MNSPSASLRGLSRASSSRASGTTSVARCLRPIKLGAELIFRFRGRRAHSDVMMSLQAGSCDNMSA